MIKVEVTQEDIDEGKKCSEGTCVIELASARALGVEPDRVKWGYTSGGLLDEDRLTEEKVFFVENDDKDKVLNAIWQNDHSLQRVTQPFAFSMYEEGE